MNTGFMNNTTNSLLNFLVKSIFILTLYYEKHHVKTIFCTRFNKKWHIFINVSTV